jgi:hypothetical protein
VAAGEEKERAGTVVVDATFVDETGCRVSLGLWRDAAKLAAANVGKIFYAYDVLVNAGNDDHDQFVLKKLSMLQTSRVHVPDTMEHTSAARLLLAGDLRTDDLRDLAPSFAGGRYDQAGQEGLVLSPVAGSLKRRIGAVSADEIGEFLCPSCAGICSVLLRR